MSYLALGSVVLLTVLLQTAVAPRFSLLDVRPDLLLILIVAWGTARGLQEAITGGVVGGILLDIVSGAPFGLTTIALLPVSFIAGQSRPFFQGTHLLTVLAIVFCGTFIYDSIFLLGLQSTGWDVDWLTSLTGIFVPVAVLNSLVSPLPFWVLGRFHSPVV